MAKVSVMMIIGRVVTDTDFRELFYNDLEKVFAMYPDLSVEEKEALKTMPKESTEKFASELDNRISKAHCDQF